MSQMTLQNGTVLVLTSSKLQPFNITGKYVLGSFIFSPTLA